MSRSTTLDVERLARAIGPLFTIEDFDKQDATMLGAFDDTVLLMAQKIAAEYDRLAAESTET